MSIKISAVICTYNQENYLRKAINSLVNQSLSSEEFEIVIVDNASTDNTKKVVEEFSHVSNIKYVYEPRLGLSYARNTGFKNAVGKYIAYLDDDAVVCPKWLEYIIKAFESNPGAGCVGGKIAPIWESPRPKWLHDQLLSWLTTLDHGSTPKFLEDKEWVWGTNMSFLAERLKISGGFRTSLGRKGSLLLSGEEMQLQDNIRERGYKIYYDPKIEVSHHVHPERLTKEWFFNRFFWQAVTDVEMKKVQPSLYDGLKELAKFDLASITVHTEDPSKFLQQCRVMRLIGRIVAPFMIKAINDKIKENNESKNKN